MSTRAKSRPRPDTEPLAPEFDSADEPTGPGRIRRATRRLAPWLAALALVGVAAAAYFLVLQRGSSDSTPIASGEARTQAAPAEFRDLLEQESFDGTLGYAGATTVASQRTGTVTQVAGESSTVGVGESLYSLDGVPVILMDGTAPAWRTLGLALDDEPVVNQLAGTITRITPEGRTRSAGDVLYRVGQQPVVLMDGALPAWRSLSAGAENGADVHQLEENLVALGYDPDGTVGVDL